MQQIVRITKRTWNNGEKEAWELDYRELGTNKRKKKLFKLKEDAKNWYYLEH